MACNNRFLIQRPGLFFIPKQTVKNRLLSDQRDISAKTNQGSVAVGPQAQLHRGIGPTLDPVVRGTCSCLDSLGNHRVGRSQEDQPSPLQTSGLTECLWKVKKKTQNKTESE